METYVDWIAPTFVLSLTALPVASVPCALDEESMPVGLQIVGSPSDEESVLALRSGRAEGEPGGIANAPEGCATDNHKGSEAI